MKKQILFRLLLALLLLGLPNSICAQESKSNTINESIRLETDRIFDKLVQIRRNFHQNPELAGKEIHTQQTIKKYLQDLGLQVETDAYGYGVVGILKGNQKGKNIAWRADMDALPNDFPDKADFKSKVQGVQHGCGHDVHLAIALGVAEVLSAHKNELHGTAYFIFQPEEETFAGAKNMIQKGWIDRYKIDEIYALHVTATPVGQIMVKSNELFAYQKELHMAFQTALTEEEVQQLSAKIKQLLVRTSNGSKPWEIQSMVDPAIGLASPNTIFADYCIAEEHFRAYPKDGAFYIDAEVYETDAARLKEIIPAVKRLIQEQGYGSRLLSVSFIKQNPTVQNDPKLTQAAIDFLDRLYGKGFVVSSYGQVPYFNDDFAYFQQKIPGVYFFLGGSNFNQGIIAMNHAPNFEVDESCIRTGVGAFSSLLFDRLK
ncbi:M20 metallopeptidase family protein [Flavobacterium sp.]|uniref:M20 metallopeptidase family protein n=1 Tax=Flavobacterium sp. TaxID=239 RepID=UPI0039E4F35A